ncbi:PadR family transcriptional regulator [Thermococcus barossii]|uniref:PadR family transcriptional regulator n=1 Tax=Thermococcus barossii TaxID=54077 RepID=A0A2Z2MGT0_9EURY|nr:PadR family transcriptional regulator [Thermococcus barossii]ASJ04893.1 PadR family transcriptional regulator [Thermococcus barossii]
MERPSFKGYMKILVLDLLREPMHGYGIMSELENLYGIKLSAGTVYPILSSLRRSGLIKVAGTGARDRKTYILTEKGRMYLEEHAEELDEVKRRMRAYRAFLELGGDELRAAFREFFESADKLTDEQREMIQRLFTGCARELRLILLGGGSYEGD